MTPRSRVLVFLPAAAVLGVVLAAALGALPHFGDYRGPYGYVLNQVAVPERHVTDAVTAVSIDYRGFDTLGEAFTFLAAVLGVAVVLRGQRDGPGQVEDHTPGRAVPPTSDAVRVLGLGLTPPSVLFGIYIVLHGHLTPGGGFQGGVILATGVLLIYLAGEFDDLHGLCTEVALERAGAFAVASYLAIGGLGLIAGSTFLDNRLSLGRIGQVFSAGSVPLVNLAIGLEVMAGLVLLISAFLHQTLRRTRSSDPVRDAPRRRRG